MNKGVYIETRRSLLQITIVHVRIFAQYLHHQGSVILCAAVDRPKPSGI